MTRRLFIDGGAGTTGLEIADRMAGRADFTLLTLNEAERKDPARRAEALNDADFVILCLPDDAAREAAAMVRNPTVRIIDASSAHRTAPGWTYGFAERSAAQRAAIAGAARVSNPGCYATGFVALVAPLIDAGLIAPDAALTCNAVSGHSGGGKALIERFGRETDLGYRSYALTLDHKHVPEMQAQAGLTTAPLFVPAVVPVLRGMMVDVPLHAKLGGGAAMHAALSAHYAGSPAVRVAEFAADNGGELLLRDGADPSDLLTIHVFSNAAGDRVRLVAMLDNLGKGASGACVQNLNLMAGLDETLGLRLG